MKQYFTYIVTNQRNTVLYTGFIDSLAKRIWQHKNKVLDGFTAKYNVDKLIYYEIFENPLDGITREKQIKNLVRRKKIELINNINPEWNDLYDSLI